MLMDIVLGIVGAVVGGFIALFAGFSGITGFNLYSISYCRRWSCRCARCYITCLLAVLRIEFLVLIKGPLR